MKKILLALLLPSCSLTSEQKQTLEANLVKDGAAALGGAFSTGTWQGAAAAAGAQAVRNHTAAKNPVNVIP